MRETVTNYEMLPLYLKVDEVCDVLRIGRSSAYELIRCGKIPSVRIGRKIRVPREFLQSLAKTM